MTRLGFPGGHGLPGVLTSELEWRTRTWLSECVAQDIPSRLSARDCAKSLFRFDGTDLDRPSGCSGNGPA